jgi:hypothetical protein
MVRKPDAFRELQQLLGKAREEPWQEAFTADPHTSSEPTTALSGGTVKVRTVLPPTELERAEVEHQEDKENALTNAYREASEQFSFKEICDAYLHALLEWKLGPLASTSKWLAQLDARGREVAEEEARGANPLQPGSALLRRQAVLQRGEFIKRLVLELPELRDRDADFFASRELRTMPSLMLHAYLRAGLAVTPGRRAWPADAYDVVHLTHGLSRCDLVTADRGMFEMVLEVDSGHGPSHNAGQNVTAFSRWRMRRARAEPAWRSFRWRSWVGRFR